MPGCKPDLRPRKSSSLHEKGILKKEKIIEEIKRLKERQEKK